jgi:hypothetical protein
MDETIVRQLKTGSSIIRSLPVGLSSGKPLSMKKGVLPDE